MTNLLAQAINCDDPDRAAKIIRDATASSSMPSAPGARPWPTSRRVRRPLGKSKQRAGYFSQRPAHGQ